MKTILVTGSSGLIGSEVASYFSERGFSVAGVDNNMRRFFFGEDGDTRWNTKRLAETLPGFIHYDMDIRNRDQMRVLVKELKPDLIVHAAAQPSHDRAAEIPFEDFEVNAVGTLNLLQAARVHCPESPFVYLSTSKVYGDSPNGILLEEHDSRYAYGDPAFADGIPEEFPIDQSLHSLFGASKLAADIMVQEYGRYFNMPTTCLRGACLTGPAHSGVEMHGFLSYLIKCNVEGREYRVYGYKGKQVRDNIASVDVASFIHAFYESPRSAEVYNLGGGNATAISILEAFEMAEATTGKKMKWTYIDQSRKGDHIVYISDLAKIRDHFPEWEPSKSLKDMFAEMASDWQHRLADSQAFIS